MLGSGLYFADDFSTSQLYTNATTKGTKFMLVANVALGDVKQLRKIDSQLVAAPDGFHSVQVCLFASDRVVLNSP